MAMMYTCKSRLTARSAAAIMSVQVNTAIRFHEPVPAHHQQVAELSTSW